MWTLRPRQVQGQGWQVRARAVGPDATLLCTALPAALRPEPPTSSRGPGGLRIVCEASLTCFPLWPGPPLSTIPPRRQRQERTVYSAEQRQELEQFFGRNQYPTYQERETLAARLNLQEHQVQV